MSRLAWNTKLSMPAPLVSTSSPPFPDRKLSEALPMIQFPRSLPKPLSTPASDQDQVFKIDPSARVVVLRTMSTPSPGLEMTSRPSVL